MAPSQAYGDRLVQFVDQLLERLEERGLMERIGTDVRLTRAGVEVAGHQPGEDLHQALERLAAAVGLEEPHVS